MTRAPIDHAPEIQRGVVIDADLALAGQTHDDERATPRKYDHSRLEEAAGLALALGIEVVAEQSVRLRKTHPATLFGQGKVEEMAELIEATKANLCIVNAALTPVQQRNLEKTLGVKVIDRTGLILEIFGLRARTREGKLQVELARLDYEKSRLVRTWTHLERQRATGSTGGPGETQIELDRRLIADRIKVLKAELAEVRRTRGLHRKARKKIPYPIVALIGYTNAGKSTLFNHLTRAEVLAKDMLFATLDTTLRTLRLPNGRPALISDTVGFISDLPHELVDAFRATLEEVVEADLILHVRDISNPETDAQKADVEQVLRGIHPDLDQAQLIEVWNKIDLLDADYKDVLYARAVASKRSVKPHLVSSLSGEGIEGLLALIARKLDQDGTEIEVTLTPDQGQVMAFLYAQARILGRFDDEAGHIHLRVMMNDQTFGRYERMVGHVFSRSIET